jgi:hypothetical protein
MQDKQTFDLPQTACGFSATVKSQSGEHLTDGKASPSITGNIP